MQGFRALAYELMKAHIEELAAKNQQIQAEVSSLKSGSVISPSGDITLLRKKVTDLRAELSSLKCQLHEKDKYFADGMSS